MRCGKCGEEIHEGEKFCANCGSPVAAQADRYCQSCGKKLTADDVFCPECGARNEMQVQAPVSAAGMTAEYPRRERTDKTKKKTNGAVIGILIGVIVLLLAASAVIVLNALGIIHFGGSEQANTEQTVLESPVPSVMPTPSATLPAAIASTPAPTPTVQPTPVAKEHTYKVVVAHISWEEARDAAVREGGHLVTFQNQEEFNKVVSLLGSYSGVKNVWIGACAPAGLTSKTAAADYWNSSQATWITGEPFTFAKWRNGEPSGYDAKLGVEERYVQIFCPASDGGIWTYNDAGSDLSEYKPNTLAYVIEFE